MGFLLYKKEGCCDSTRYTLVRKMPMVGQSGALTTWLRSNSKATSPFSWELTGEKLVRAFAPDVAPATHTLVMDMMPEKLAGASLCNVVSIAGNSEHDETDIVIVMREISLVDMPAYGTDIRQSFICDSRVAVSDLIESIGISGGTRGGTYRWCAPKMNIGAAVYRARPARTEAALSAAR